MKIAICLLVLFASCNSNIQTAPSVPATTPTAAPVAVAISLKQVIAAFESLPITSAVVYDERTDPNGLLGRPNRYVEKMNFTDKRIKHRDNNCSIEVFRNEEDALARKEYIEAIGKAAAPFDFYYFLHRNVLVRIDLKLIPSEADEYRLALESITTALPGTV